MANDASSSDQFLNFFWDLASFDPAVRQEAALNLTVHLVEAQHAFEKNTSDEIRHQIEHHRVKTNQALDIELADLESCTHQDVAYAAKRLVRGLSSPRQGARQGFSLALSMLIEKVLNFVTIDSFVNWINSLNPLAGGLKRFEQRDMLFGRVFGCIAIIQADIYDRNHVSVNDSYVRLIEYLIKCSFEKHYLRELGAYSIASLFDKVPAKVEFVFPIIQDKIVTEEEGVTAESLIILFAADAFVKSNREETFKCYKLKNCLDLSHPENYQAFEDALLNSPVNAHPRIHSVWKEMLRAILASPNACDRVASFWNYFVDERLCNSTVERKFLALSLFGYLLPVLDERDLPLHLIFSERFLTFFLDCLKDPKKILNKNAVRTFDTLLTYARKDRKMVFQFMSRISLPAHYKHTCIERLLQTGLDNADQEKIQEEVTGYISWLIESFDDQSSDSAQKKQWCLNQLVGVIRNKKIQRTETTVSQIITFLIQCSFDGVDMNDVCQNFAIDAPPNLASSIDTAARNSARLSLFYVLSELQSIDIVQKVKRSPKNCGKTSQNQYWIVTIVRAISKYMKSMPDEIDQEALDIIFSNSFEKDSIQFTFATLLLHYWCADDSKERGECEGTLADLIVCSSRLGYFKKGERASDDSDLPPLQVLVDCMLSLLPRKLASASTTNFFAASGLVCQHAVRMFVKEFAFELDVNCISLIASVFDPVLAFETSGDAIEDVDTESGSDSSQEEGGEEGSSDEDDSGDDEEHFCHQLALVTENASAAGDESGSDFDDEQMFSMKFDDKVASILKERKRQKAENNEKSHKKAEFVLLSLDVIENFLKQLETVAINPKQLEVLEAIIISLSRTSLLYDKATLVKAQEKYDQAFNSFVIGKVYSLSENLRIQVATKATALLKNCFSGIKMKTPACDSATIESLATFLVNLLSHKTLFHGWQVPSPSKNLVHAIGILLPWVMKIANASQPSCDVGELYDKVYVKKLLQLHFTKQKRHIPVTVFLEMLRILGNMASTNMPSIIWSKLAVAVLIKLNGSEDVAPTNHQTSQGWFLMSNICKMVSTKDTNEGSSIYARVLQLADTAAVKFVKEQQKPDKNSLKHCKSFFATLSSMRKKIGVTSLQAYPKLLHEVKSMPSDNAVVKSLLMRLADSTLGNEKKRKQSS